MFLSPILCKVGRVWKPIIDKSTTRKNDRVRSSKLVQVEDFLAKYRLRAWRNTEDSRDAETAETTKFVTEMNWDHEVAEQKKRIERRQLAVQKKEKRMADRLASIKEGLAKRDQEAKEYIEELDKEGLLSSFPSY